MKSFQERQDYRGNVFSSKLEANNVGMAPIKLFTAELVQTMTSYYPMRLTQQNLRKNERRNADTQTRRSPESR